jgi:hypothetical protein
MSTDPAKSHDRLTDRVLKARFGLALILFALVFHRFWNHSIVFRDSFILYAPLKFLIGQALRSGQIWCWNPRQFLGVPFVADILSGWFYPLNVLYALLPFEPAHRLFILLHYPLAAIGMDLFLRGRGLDRFPALAGGIVFGLCGYMLSQHANFPFLIGPALAPLALCCRDRAARGGWLWAPAAGAGLALMVFGGEPQSAAIAGMLMLAIGAAGSWAEKNPRQLAVTGLALATGLGFSSMQTLPTLELLSRSVRAGGLPLAQAGFYSFHPGYIVDLVWPTPFGRLYPDLHYWGEFAIDPSPLGVRYPWAATNYLGLTAMTLAAYGAVRSRRRWRTAALAAGVFFLLLALGRHTPLFGFLHGAGPGFTFFRYPSKYLAWFSGAVAVLAALGLEALAEEMRERPRSAARLGLAYGIAATAAVALSALAWPWAMERVGALASGSTEYLVARRRLLLGGAQIAAAALTSGTLLALAAKRSIPAAAAGAAFLLVLVLDLGSMSATMNAGPTDIFSRPSVAGRMIGPSDLPRLGSFRIYREPVNFRDRTPALAGYGEIERLCLWERATLKPNLDHLEGFEDLAGYNEAAPAEGIEMLQKPDPASLARFNVKYVITRPGADLALRLPLTANDDAYDISLARLARPWPRAYVTADAILAANEAGAMRALASIGVSERIVITGAPWSEDESGPPGIVPARILRYEPDRVEIEAAAKTPAWLVLSDRYYPGWRAWTDGGETRIYRANVATRAVRLNPGPHRVVFRFEPRTLRLGAGFFLATIFFPLALRGFARRRRRVESASFLPFHPPGNA